MLGVFPDWVYQQDEVALARGDRLVLFSDGITEAENSDGEQFGDERLRAFWSSIGPWTQPSLQRKIVSAVADFSDGALQDDSTLLVIGNRVRF